jgi:hypothetical protein
VDRHSCVTTVMVIALGDTSSSARASPFWHVTSVPITFRLLLHRKIAAGGSSVSPHTVCLTDHRQAYIILDTSVRTVLYLHALLLLLKQAEIRLQLFCGQAFGNV